MRKNTSTRNNDLVVQSNRQLLFRKQKMVDFAIQYLTYDFKRKTFIKTLNSLFDDEGRGLRPLEEIVIKIYEKEITMGYVYYFSYT